MLRRLALVGAAAAVCASVLPAQAAPKSTNLYLANTGACGTEDPVYSLVFAPSDGGECAGTFGGAAGNGVLAEETYTTLKNATFKVDVARPVTGTVHLEHFGIVSLVEPSLPGYAKVNFTLKADSTTVGTFTAEGPITPAGSLKKDFSLKLPASLKNKTVKRFTLVADYDTAVGLTGISYSAPNHSMVIVPVR